MRKAKHAMQAKAQEGKEIVVLHLGDHDPSGIDMSRDISERLNGFAMASFSEGLEGDDYAEWMSFEVEVVRLGLNMDQVKKYNPPPNPAKMTDSRAQDYVKKFGKKSWELDALNPTTIADLIHREVKKRLDCAAWERSLAAERASILKLDSLIDSLDKKGR